MLRVFFGVFNPLLIRAFLSNEEGNTSMNTPLEIHPKEAKSLLSQSSVVWLDIRENEEWEYGHLSHAQHIPMSRMTPESFSKFPKEQKMIIVCRSGGRSLRVTHALRNQGFIHAQSLAGGMIGMNTLLGKQIPVLMH
jgi:rhodanese-related sulfurtransferase